MKIVDCRLHTYSLPFAKPFIVSGQSLENRQGIIVELLSDQNHSGLGEIAPLPGLSPENFKKVVYEINQIRSFFLNCVLPDEFNSLISWLRTAPVLKNAPSSVRFGVESAVLQLRAQIEKKMLAQMLGAPNIPVAVPTACLLQGNFDEIVQEAKAKKRKDYLVFKLKVGSKNIPLDVKKVLAVQEAVGEDCLVRLDANRSWSLTEAVTFAQHIKLGSVQFIEEPVKNSDDILKFFEATRMPVALDESLWHKPLDQIKPVRGVEFCVLKPMFLGGVVKTLDCIKQLRSLGISCVISAAFESGVGLNVLANLSLLTLQVPGLGTFNYFKEDLLKKPLIDDQGCIKKEKLYLKKEDLNIKFLKMA